MLETKSDPWVRNPLEKEKATHSSILARRIPWTGIPQFYVVHGVTKSQLSAFHSIFKIAGSFGN